MKHKQQVSAHKAHLIHRSCQLIMVLTECIRLEYANDMIDSDFKSPQANQFARRIISDCKQIQHHILHHPNYKMEVTDNDFVEEYASEIHRLINLFLGLPLEQVKEVVRGLEEVSLAENIL